MTPAIRSSRSAGRNYGPPWLVQLERPHGVRTLSVLCGFRAGVFAGVAPRANVIPYRVTNFVVISGLLNNHNNLA